MMWSMIWVNNFLEMSKRECFFFLSEIGIYAAFVKVKGKHEVSSSKNEVRTQVVLQLLLAQEHT